MTFSPTTTSVTTQAEDTVHTSNTLCLLNNVYTVRARNSPHRQLPLATTHPIAHPGHTCSFTTNPSLEIIIFCMYSGAYILFNKHSNFARNSIAILLIQTETKKCNLHTFFSVEGDLVCTYVHEWKLLLKVLIGQECF